MTSVSKTKINFDKAIVTRTKYDDGFNEFSIYNKTSGSKFILSVVYGKVCRYYVPENSNEGMYHAFAYDRIKSHLNDDFSDDPEACQFFVDLVDAEIVDTYPKNNSTMILKSTLKEISNLTKELAKGLKHIAGSVR